MLTPAGRSRFPSFHTKGTRFHWIYKSCMAVYCPRNNEESNNLKIILKWKEKSFEPNLQIWSFKMFLFAGVRIQHLHCLKKANGFHASSIHEMREYCLDAFFPQDFQHVKVSCLCSFGGPVSNDSDSFVLSVMMVVFNDWSCRPLIIFGD